MTNRDKYRFDDFTIANYRRMMEIAIDNGFLFKGYMGDGLATDDSKEPIFNWNQKLILWRHDVEFSPYIALRMARIESELGVKATYFCQLHSEFYNLMERAVSDIVLEIASLGHDIGLHFDSHYWQLPHCNLDVDNNRQILCSRIKCDAGYFSDAIGINPKCFSFHCTDDFIMSCDDLYYADLLNVYSKFFKTRFAYCADSTGFWRYERLIDRLQDRQIKYLQVLTHDAMWSEQVLSPRKRVLQQLMIMRSVRRITMMSRLNHIRQRILTIK